MFINILLQAIAGALKVQLILLIEKHKELHGEEKNEQLKGAISNSFKLLKDVTDKTKSKIDDTVVKIVLEATEEA